MSKLVSKKNIWQCLLGIFVLIVFDSCSDEDPYNPYANFDYEAQARLDDQLIQEYMKANNITDTVKTTTGLYYKVLPVPDPQPTIGPKPTSGQKVKAHYVGRIISTSQKFESTYDTGRGPAEFVVGKGELIKGWDEGILMMHKGQRALLLIPSHLAYGITGAPSSTGYGYTVPPITPIMFEIDLIDIL